MLSAYLIRWNHLALEPRLRARLQPCLLSRSKKAASAAEVRSRFKRLLFSALTVIISGSTSLLAQSHPIAFNQAWWSKLDESRRWNFIYGFTDCRSAPRSGLNMGQYDDFITSNVSSESDSVPKLIRLAPHRVKVLHPPSGGEVWKDKHGFNDGDLWGDHFDEGRAWVEGYLACQGRSVLLPQVDRYVHLIIGHYADPQRHSDKIADVLQPLLRKTVNP